MVYDLMGERNSYPVAPAITVIPAKAGIHCSGRSEPSDLPDYV